MNNSDPNDLMLRPASFKDIAFIRNIALQTWPVAYAAILSKAQLNYMLDAMYSPEALHKQISDGHYFYLALYQFEAVGFCSISSINQDTFKLQKLYVLPNKQKHGIGEALLDVAETTSKSRGAKYLQLNVNRNNPAQHFYQKHGFTVIEQVDINIGNNYYMNDYIMQKSL